MITRDMALGGHEGAVHTQPLDQNPFDVNQQSSDNVPIVLPHEISPPDGAVFVDQTTVDPPLVTSNTIERTAPSCPPSAMSLVIIKSIKSA
jgi:hypothetical protein